MTLALLFLLAVPFGLNAQQPVDQNQFEVASLKECKDTDPHVGGGLLPGGRLDLLCWTFKGLISMAYNVPDDVIVGPAWIESVEYSLVAKAPPPISSAVLRTMMQSLLAERFKLKVHTEKRKLPVYAFTLEGKRLKLQRATEAGRPHCDLSVRPGSATQVYSCRNVTIGDLAAEWIRLRARDYIDRPVIDQTGLTDPYDFSIEWTPERIYMAAADAPNAARGNGLTIFTAVAEQLGLKLVKTEAPVEVLVVDEATRIIGEN
jgi:uncharacterized protein (TIGR03435 family)